MPDAPIVVADLQGGTLVRHPVQRIVSWFHCSDRASQAPDDSLRQRIAVATAIPKTASEQQRLVASVDFLISNSRRQHQLSRAMKIEVWVATALLAAAVAELLLRQPTVRIVASIPTFWLLLGAGCVVLQDAFFSYGILIFRNATLTQRRLVVLLLDLRDELCGDTIWDLDRRRSILRKTTEASRLIDRDLRLALARFSAGERQSWRVALGGTVEQLETWRAWLYRPMHDTYPSWRRTSET